MRDDAPRTFSRIGGHVALDLLNTVEWRLDPQRAIEDLPDYESVLAWAQQSEILAGNEIADVQRLASAQPRLPTAEHSRFLQLRETAYEALIHDSPQAVDELTSAYRNALQNAHLRHDEPNWTWSERSITLATPHDRVTRHVIALLTSTDLGQLHQCEDAACGWVYLDTSPRRNRRWCSAADCGNATARAATMPATEPTPRRPPTDGGDRSLEPHQDQCRGLTRRPSTEATSPSVCMPACLA